ncbi:MAG: thermonuclease family protein [Candidatus Aenigmatarchaeota archaeon]
MKIKKLLTIFFTIFFSISIVYFVQNSVKSKNSVEKVSQIIDGDTIELTNGQKIRLLGIDAPEKGQYYYKEASNRLEQLVKGKEVFLEKDVSNRDNYGRLLRYVYVGGLFVNLEMVKEGYARALVVAPNLKYSYIFLRAENEARTKGIGIWVSVKS